LIALIVGDRDMRSGSLRLALSQAGFEPRDTLTTDQADWNASNHDGRSCVLIVEASWLGKRAGSATWASFLTAHPHVPAVVVAPNEVDGQAHRATQEPHRVLVDHSAAPAAVAAAALRIAP
jgi:hypothetical protein